MELSKALAQISEIHAQVLRTEVFRGYRALPMAVTSALALATAAAHALAIAPGDEPAALTLWLGYAAACALVCGADLCWHAHARGRRVRQQALRVVAQFVPALAAGLATTLVVQRVPDALALLPGLWVVLFALGIVATLPYLPRALLAVASFYLLAGIALLWLARPGLLPAPWLLGLTFATGQGLAAYLLHRTLEA